MTVIQEDAEGADDQENPNQEEHAGEDEEGEIVVEKEEVLEEEQEIIVEKEDNVVKDKDDEKQKHEKGGDSDDDDALIYKPNNNPDTNNMSIFPAPFYCPITKKLFEDPVVAIDGISYERDALQKDDVYPNRALQEVMEEALEMAGPSFRATLMRLQHSMRSTLQEVMDKSMLPSKEYHPLPEAYYCPITFNLIHEPVIDPEGNTFERVAVENWIRVNGTSPTTRTACTLEQLRPNHAIQDLLDLERNKTDASIHPSIRKWKEETPPQATDPELGGEHVAAAASGNQPSQQGVGGNPFPTTAAELLAEERARSNRRKCSLIAFVFMIVFLVLFFMFGTFGLLFGAVLCCNYACNLSSPRR